MSDDQIEQRREVAARRVDLGDRPAVAPRSEQGREIELVFVGVEQREQVEDLVVHGFGAGVGAVDLVDHHDRPQTAAQRLGDDELGLRHRPFSRVDEHQHAVDHREDALDLAAEIGVARRVDDVDARLAPHEGGAFGENRDAALALEVVRIEGTLGDLLVGAEHAGLTQKLIDQRRLAVVDMRDDRDVTNIHGHSVGDTPSGNTYTRPAEATSLSSAASGRAPTWLMISAAHKLPIAPQVGSGKPWVKPNSTPAA
jgi:hypothetical protein